MYSGTIKEILTRKISTATIPSPSKFEIFFRALPRQKIRGEGQTLQIGKSQSQSQEYVSNPVTDIILWCQSTNPL